MRLHEEYINRHKLDIPIVRYDSASTVFLRSKDVPVGWRIINIRWHSCHWHPGHFTIKITSPSHNRGDRLQDVVLPVEVHWDEYENRILAIARSSRRHFLAVPRIESDLSAWYIFLLMYDAYMIRTSSSVKEFIAESVDQDVDLLLRHLAARKAQSLLAREDEPLYEAFRRSVQPLTEKYADWLVNLING